MLLVVGLAAVVLGLGLDRHGAWDPAEVDQLLAPDALRAWFLRSFGSARASNAVVVAVDVLLATRAAALIAGRRAAILTACVLLAMPAVVLGARLGTRDPLPSLGATLVVVSAIAMLGSRARRPSLVDGALGLVGGAILAVRAPSALVAPGLAVGALAVARMPSRMRGAAIATAAGLASLGIGGAALAGSETIEHRLAEASWASGLEPLVYGALPWVPLAPFAAHAVGSRAAAHPAHAGLFAWALAAPFAFASPLGVAVPLGVLVGVALASRARIGAGWIVAVAIAVVLAADVAHGASPLLEVAVSEPPSAPSLHDAWRALGLGAVVLAVLGSLASRGTVALALAGAASLGFALLLAHGWLPAISRELSHAELFEELSRAPEARFGALGLRRESARFFVGREPEPLASPRAALDFLRGGEPAFAVAPRSAHCAIRQDARAVGASMHTVGRDEAFVLLSNRPGARDLDPLAAILGPARPTLRGRGIHARLDHVDLVDVVFPESVRRGGTVRGALIFRVRERLPRDLRVFIHVDGTGSRIQGDHDPLGGACPTSRWLPGDYALDRFELDAGTLTHPSGRYGVYVGLYHGVPGGWANLRVEDGPHDAHDRVYVGELELR
ncbi:MAG: hypothetical protein AB7S26_29885 [Sandaracinaceae bacterium]